MADLQWTEERERTFRQRISLMRFMAREPYTSVAEDAEVLLQERERLVTALRGVLAEPHGCPMCDSGTLRNPSKRHWPECPYLIAQQVLNEELLALVKQRAAPQAGPCGTALRQLHDAVMKIWGDPEDCDSCSALGDVGEHNPCALHGSSALYDAVMVSRGVLGPCVCGHTVRQHEDVDTTRCRECRCHAFKFPPQPPERPSTGEEPR